MMIVTHEMRFARDVSTRVLYLDEGGIYEDGTPEQIFEHPIREKTRQFIHRLRTLPFDIPSYGAFDFLGVLTEIERFGKENMLPPVAIRNLQLFFEETITQNIVPHLNSQGNGYPIRCVIEHSEADGTTTLSIDYGGDSYNPMLDGNPLSVRLVEGIASHVKHTCDPSNRLVLTI